MSSFYVRQGMGWLPDYPDFRDYTPEHDRVASVLKAANLTEQPRKAVAASVDLRAWCSPIENQGSLGSCTANAGVGVYEYFERRAYGKHIDASRLFLYKTTRNLMHWTGDTGAFLRSTMAAMVLFGVPPEEYWPYQVEEFEAEPPAFCYSFAQNYQAITYVRLDPPGTSAEELLSRIRTYLASGLPAMFGFTVFNSIDQAAGDGKIPYPTDGERVIGGHAIVAVGYDDKLKITNTLGGGATTGAFLIRNSWGTDWGEGGYGWLPYAYLESELADDWWTLAKGEWTDTGRFGT